jgi:hypothetical protein
VPATGDVVEVARMGGEQHRHGGRGYPARSDTRTPFATASLDLRSLRGPVSGSGDMSER